MALTDVWRFHDEAVARIDLRGFEVQARDGAIGRVAQTMEGSGGGYLVVDPGVAMPLGRHLLVPAGVVQDVDVDRARISVDVDREQVQNAPEYDRSRPLDDAARREFGDYYGSFLERGASARQRRRPSSRRRSTRATSRPRASREPTKDELYQQAKKLDIEGRSKMSKAQLARAVSRRGGRSARRTSATANPVEVQRFLEGVGYPTRKRKLLREAESRRASRDVRATLERLPDKEFKSPTDVSKAIGNLS